MFEYVRVATCVPKVSVGNVKANLQDILNKLAEAEEKGADLVLFPELAVTGYTVGDLFFQTALLEEARQAVNSVAEATEGKDLTAVFGAPLSIAGQLYDCAVVARKGQILGVVPKTFLSDKGISEKRWFSSASDLTETYFSAKSLGLNGDGVIAVMPQQVFSIGSDYKFGVELAEDLSAAVSPGALLALSGAEIIVNLAAVGETVNARRERRCAIKRQSAASVCTYAYVSAGCGESTSDQVFAGHSVIAENGRVLFENDERIAESYLLIGETDLGRVRADRLKNKNFKDCAVLYGSLCHAEETTAEGSELHGDGSLYPVNKLPFVPDTAEERKERCDTIFELQVAGLRKRMALTGAKPVIGVSGGLDSTLALLVSAEAVRREGRPASDVHGLTMPCFGTTDRTHGNAAALMEALGITALEVPIKEAATLHCRDIGHPVNQFDVTFENIQARERTQVLMDYACRIGGFVVGTGDLSELALGWCTYNADHMSMYGVNGGVPKSLIRWMIAALAERDFFRGAADILKDIIDTPISPELLPPDAEGKIAQETESIVGPYALHDFFLYYTVRYGFEPEKIYELARKAFEADFEGETILRWMKVFYRRFFTQQFKRNCQPDGVKIGSVGFSPRGDWQMPSDASAALWLEKVENLSM